MYVRTRSAFFEEFSNGAVLFLGGLEAAREVGTSNSASIDLRVDCRGQEEKGRNGDDGYVPEGLVDVHKVPNVSARIRISVTRTYIPFSYERTFLTFDGCCS
jgi:hypothetical protein